MKLYHTAFLNQLLYPSSICRGQGDDTLYLTFDDGPSQEATPYVLSELKKVEAKATFFCVGRQIQPNPSLIREIQKAGHQIGNHTYSHCHGWTTSTNEYLQEVTKCDDLLQSLGVTNALFRPPYGRMTPDQIKTLRHKKTIMWSKMSWDFSSRMNHRKCLRALQNAGGGDIVLFHDSQKALENLRQILPSLLQHYKRKGLKMEALS